MAFNDSGSDDVFGGGAPSGGGGGSAMPLDPKKLLAVLKKYFWIPVITAAVGLVLAIFIAKTSKPIYRSNAEIKAERRSSAPSLSSAVEGATTPEDLKTIEQSFISPHLMELVIAKLDLKNLNDFLGRNRPAAKVSDGELIGYLMKNCKVALVPDTRLIQISFDHWNPGLAQKVCSAIVQQGLDYDRDQRVESLGANVRYLQEEASKLATKLNESQEKLNGYTRQLGSVSVDGELNIVADQLRDLNSRYTAAKSERLKLESDYEQIQSCLGDPDKLIQIDSIRKVPSVERLYSRASELRGTLVKLGQRYRPANPLIIQTETELKEVNASLKQEILQAPKSIEVALAAAKKNEENIGREKDEQEQKVIQNREYEGKSLMFKNQIDADRTAYEATLAKLNEEISQARSQPVLLQIVEPAGPGYPLSSGPAKILAMGLVGGLAIGGGILFLIMQLDVSIKSAEDAESAFGLSVLASVPEYAPPSAEDDASASKQKWQKSKKKLAPPDLNHCPVFNDEHSSAAEAFRTLRATIQIAEGTVKNNLILMTSFVPEEGKSFCCLNLGVAMAQSGQRTLLVDAQLRKPTLEERIFSSRGSNGLSDFLEGTVDFSSVIRATRIPNLDVVTAGSPSPHPAEILSRQRFRDFLDMAQPHYDKIIFDSAAITPVSDTLSFARIFPIICVVLQAGSTSKTDGKRAMELLSRAGARPFGMIVNQVAEQLQPDYGGYGRVRFSDAGDEPGLDFPKACPSCGRVYENFDDYLKRTLPPSELEAKKAAESSSFQRSIQFFRICPCGSPVMVAADNRRDVSAAGRERRELFEELQKRLIASGYSKEEARTKLLLTLKIWRNEIFSDSHQDGSEAGTQRRQLFSQVLDHLVRSGIKEEEARAKLLQAIKIWRNAP